MSRIPPYTEQGLGGAINDLIGLERAINRMRLLDPNGVGIIASAHPELGDGQ